MLTPRVTTITLPGGVRRTTESRVVNVVLLPFIRARKVYFRIQGLVPNTRHRPYFDGIDVSAWCREETFQRVGNVDADLENENSASLTSHPDGSSNLISDANGDIEGSFFVPNTSSIRFRAGRREFKVLDWNATTDENAISKAFGAYTAQGVLENREQTITTINPPPPLPPQRPRFRFIDPVAQSFLVDRPEGFFAAAVDVYMATKSSTVPLQVQIRPMINGTPSNAPVPGAHVFVPAADVVVNSSPTYLHTDSRTRVRFEAPVYLQGGVEYAVVLLAETDDYTTWTAVMSEFQVGSTDRRIMKQPSLGSFFKSQNGSTWTPDQSRDLMFAIRRCSFGTNSTGTAYFENVANRIRRLPGGTPANVLSVGSNPLVRIHHPNHGMFTGSRVTLSGFPSMRGLTTGNINTTHVIVDADDADYYTVQITGTSTSSGFAGDSSCYATENLPYNTIFPNVNQMQLPGTGVDWSAATTPGRSVAGDETPYGRTGFSPITVNDNNDTVNPGVIASTVNETNNQGGVKSLAMQAVLSNTSDTISPVIDLSRMSVNLIENRIDKQNSTELSDHNTPEFFVAETDPRSGSSLAKHIFRPVTLIEPAEGLKILMGANRPVEAEIEVYYRAVGAGSDTAIEDTNWALVAVDRAIQPDEDPNIFREYEYTLSDLEPFNTFQIKIVFNSHNSSAVPRVKDFRAIALAT